MSSFATRTAAAFEAATCTFGTATDAAGDAYHDRQENQRSDDDCNYDGPPNPRVSLGGNVVRISFRGD